MSEPFIIHTYAAAKRYVPVLGGNREGQKAGKPFFHAEIEPMNATEYEDQLLLTKDDPDVDLDRRTIERRVPRLFDLVIVDKDSGKKVEVKSGRDLYGEAKRMLDYHVFKSLVRELVTAATKHSVLAEGELSASDSPSE